MVVQAKDQAISMFALLGWIILIITGISWLLEKMLGPFIALTGTIGQTIAQINSNAWLLMPIGVFLVVSGSTGGPRSPRGFAYGIAAAIIFVIITKWWLKVL